MKTGAQASFQNDRGHRSGIRR